MVDKRREPKASDQASRLPRKNATVLPNTIWLHKGNNSWEGLSPFLPPPPFSEEDKRLLVLKLRAGLDDDGLDLDTSFFETFDTSTTPPRLIKTNVPAVQLTLAERRFLVDLLTPEEEPKTEEEKSDRERFRRFAIKLRTQIERERVAKCVNHLMIPKTDGGLGLDPTAAIRLVAKIFTRSPSSVWDMYDAGRKKSPRKQRLKKNRKNLTPNSCK